jgi:hypothetical protein
MTSTFDVGLLDGGSSGHSDGAMISLQFNDCVPFGNQAAGPDTVL